MLEWEEHGAQICHDLRSSICSHFSVDDTYFGPLAQHLHNKDSSVAAFKVSRKYKI